MAGGRFAPEILGEPCVWPSSTFTGAIDVTRVILLTSILALVAVALPCDAQPRALDPKRSTVTVRVFKSGLFRAFADDHVIEAPFAEGSLDDSATRRNAGRWSVRGELEVHGQTHPVTVNVLQEQHHYKGSTSLKQSDFGITPISIAGGTVKVKDEIKIDFDIVTTER